ncbi:MAG: ABC-F family ATP-binding cassette domain-containing protein [Hyphomonadaceae bacterium]
MRDVRLSMGVAPLFEGVDFTIHRGERVSLVGANGVGKTTLMRMLAGAVEPDSGEVGFANGVTIAWTAQEPDFSGFATLRDFAAAPSATRTGVAAVAPIHAAEAELLAFGLDPDRAVAGLSGGEARRASLARAFAADADILLLDEPTNHLDIAAIEALEQRLQQRRGACLVISHDRRFLEHTTTAMLWLRQRRVLKLDRGFAAFDEWADQVEIEEARALSRLETQLRAEEHWLQRGVTARRSRNEGRRRKLMAMRAERRERRAEMGGAGANLSAERGAQSSRLVIDAKAIAKSYGERTLIQNVSLRVMRGDRIGIVGPNGAGKTTLLDILLKRRDPDSGEVRHGENLAIAYVDQNRAALKGEVTLWDALTPNGGDAVVVRGHSRHVASYARDFLFTPEQLRQPVRALSGGERNRLALAIALAKPANVLVLDEPTNDLDMDTLDALEDMLAGYDGVVLLVSHDRAFLDGVATQILGPLGGGRWAETPGGWSDFEREYGARFKPAPAPRPKTTQRETHTAARPTKLGYKDERRAAEIEALLPKLEEEISALERRLADPDLFGREPAEYQRAADRLERARAEKESAEAEWLDIEMRREQLAGA